LQTDPDVTGIDDALPFLSGKFATQAVGGSQEEAEAVGDVFRQTQQDFGLEDLNSRSVDQLIICGIVGRYYGHPSRLWVSG
jgi:hypothetical protein